MFGRRAFRRVLDRFFRDASVASALDHATVAVLRDVCSTPRDRREITSRMEIGRAWSPRERRALLLVLCAFSFFGVFDHSLWAPNDSREGAMVWDMYRSGNWTHLSLNGAPFLEKPPLLHWTALVFCHLFGGIRAGLLRLPAALYGCGALLVVHQWGKALGRERAGVLGAFLCATTLLYAEYARIVLTDICLTFMVTASLHMFWLAYSRDHAKVARYAAFVLVTALSFYAKGVLGPGLVMASVVVFLALHREWKLALALSASAVALTIAVVWPWAAALYREGGREFVASVFVDNQLGRFFALPRGASLTSLPIVGSFLGFLSDRPIPADPYFVHKEPITFYAVKLAKFWLPWTLLVPPAVVYWFRRGTTLDSPLCTLLRTALVTIVVVLHVSSAKVACYALPLFPILFLMIGVWCEDVLSRAPSRVEEWLARATSFGVRVLLFVLPCVFLIGVLLTSGAESRIDEWLRGAGFAGGSIGDAARWIRPRDALETLRGALACAAALGVAALAWRRVRARERTGDRAGGMLELTLALALVLVLSISGVLPAYDRQRTYEPLAALVRRELDLGRCIALAVGEERDVSELVFYADATFPEITLDPGVREFLAADGEPRGVVVRASDLDAVRDSLRGIEHEVRTVPAEAGIKSREFLLVTRG
jgi:4-amino-4-deoxy-L-arabinose transferase-like glycosyltransferase